MLMWFRKVIEKIKYHLSHEWCYDLMEDEGIAINGKCCGLAGGTRATDYLQEHCIGCPHLVLVARVGEERRESDETDRC